MSLTYMVFAQYKCSLSHIFLSNTDLKCRWGYSNRGLAVYLSTDPYPAAQNDDVTALE